MAWTELKTSIANVIKANGNQEITGAVLQSVLLSMIENLGWKYTYYGTVQISSEAPENTDGNIFVFPTQKGVYPNFGGLEVSNKLCIFYNLGANWIKQDLPALFYDNAIFTLLALNAATQEYAYYIASNGAQHKDPNYHTTEFIEINPGEEIMYLGGLHTLVLALSFYSADKTFISGTNFDTIAIVDSYIGTATAPENAKYVRASYLISTDFSIVIKSALKNIKHIALTVANSISDFKGVADINGDGVSIYRNVGSKAIWNTTHKYAVIDFGTSLNITMPIMSIMFYDFENKTCGNLHIGFYTAGTEFSNVVYDHLSPYIESVKYEGHKLLITFTDSCKHRIISVNEIATPNRQGNITSGETSFYASLPDGEWKDAKEVLQSGILQNNLYDQANNVGRINTNGTSISVDDNWRYTDYISVSPGQTIDCILQGHTAISSVTFYNASREVLQTNIASINGKKIERTFTAPANSAFVRICGGNPGWSAQTYKQYANTATNIWDEIYALKNIKHIALTVANSISDFKGVADINGDGVSIYRNVGSKAIWNTTHKYAVIDFGTSLNITMPIMSIMFYDFENKTCGNLHIGFYTAGTEFSNVVYDHLSPYIESVKYEGHKLLITFTDSCKHRIISVNEIATPNRQGNITSGETSFYASLPDGEWKDAKEVLQSGILQNNLYDQANNVGRINTNGTSISVDDNWRYTDYISVSPGQTIDCILQGHTAISSVTFYNASREVLQTNIASINGKKIERTFTAPANSAFVRICGGNPGWSAQTYKQYANTATNIWDEIYALKKLIGTPPTSFGVLSPYAIYTTCNDVIPSQKGRNRNYSQAVYLDHLFNGLTKELNIRFKDNIDRIVFNAPMVVTDSNETSPAVTFNGGENIHEEEVTRYVHGEDIIETPVVIKHRSTLNSITSNVHPKVLCIGDSITYAEQANIPDDNYTQNYAYHLICKELFMKDKIDNGNVGYDITFLGIYKKQKTFTYKEEEHTVITHHEGIRGISLSQHLNGNVAQFKDDKTGKWSLRAWLNKYRTLNDDGERLSLGSGTGTLITSDNLQNIDVCTPTHVIIMLGANGGGTLSQWQQMVNTIKSEFPDMIIGIAIPDTAGTYFPSLHPNCNYLCTIWNDTGSQGSRHNQQYNLQKMLQEYYGTEEQEQNNIFMLPFFFVAPTAESVALRTVPLPDAEYSITGNNKFYDHYGWHASPHVNGIGQTNWGYSLYSWLKYTMAKNLI